MSKDRKPLSPIAIRFQQDLQLKGLGERTQQSYGRALRKFTEFLGREPDTASEDDFRQYLLFIKNEKQWSSSSINVAQHGLKRFFKLTCPQDWPTLKLIRVKGELKLPTVLAIGEVHILLSTFHALRQYYATHHNKPWIFPAEGRNHKQAKIADKPMRPRVLWTWAAVS